MANDTLYLTLTDFCNNSKILYELIDPDNNIINGLLKGGYEKGYPIQTTKPERKQQLEETVKSRLEYMLETNLPSVTLHFSGQNQEILRNAGAVALTLGDDIFIREEAYNEGFSATDAILLHELTHIKQYQNRVRLTSNEEIKAAEKEAERSENLAYPLNNPNYYVECNGGLFYINKAIENEAVNHAIKLLCETIEDAIQKEDIKTLTAIQMELEGQI
jgi:hypothetical protein